MDFHLFFLCAGPFDQTLGSSLIFFICTGSFDQSQGSLLVFNLFFLNCANISFSIFKALLYLYLTVLYLYFTFALFLTALPLYFVRYIDSSTSYPYISYTIFMEVLLLYFECYNHGYMKSLPTIATYMLRFQFLLVVFRVPISSYSKFC